MLRANWDVVDEIVRVLLEKKEMDFDDLEEVFEKFGKKKKYPSAAAVEAGVAKIGLDAPLLAASEEKSEEL